MGISTTYFPGESIAKFDVSKDFPSLHADSQQARDISRFRWFSDDWLALDSQDNSVIVDMRYSQLPNAIKGLWGIRIKTDSSPETHIEWVAQRETSATEVNALWQQIKGEGAKSLPVAE